MTAKANAEAFSAEMQTNPMGDRTGLREVGPYIVERYARLLFHEKRRRDGEPQLERLQVWIADADHWRTYRRLGSLRATEDEIADDWDRLTTTDAVEDWIETHGDDE